LLYKRSLPGRAGEINPTWKHVLRVRVRVRVRAMKARTSNAATVEATIVISLLFTGQLIRGFALSTVAL
jgi:hypothetical protein